MQIAKAATTHVTTNPAPAAQPVFAKRDRCLANEVRIGNQAMLRRLSRTTPHVQRKLQIGTVNDPLEAEADRVAEQVMRMSDPAISSTGPSHLLHRKCAACEEEDEKLQRKAMAAAPAVTPPVVLEVLNSPGSPLDPQTRAFFEPRFGADLGSVRLHYDDTAARSAQSVSAMAYTSGRHIAFARDRYQPQTSQGKTLLAHELTHTLQQGLGEEVPHIQRQTAEEDAGTTPSGAGAAAAPAGAAGPGATGATGVAGVAPSCSPPSYCPTGFCVALPLPKVAVEMARNQAAPTLLAGIAAVVSPRVVPVWNQYLFGGSAPQNFTSTFSADFSASSTTFDATNFLELALVKSLKANPPAFPPGNVTTVNLPRTDITGDTIIPAAIKALGTPDVPGEMDFSKFGEIPGNLAGGIGKDEAACAVGAKPSPFNDDRTATGTAIVTKNPDGSMTVVQNLMFHVTDTVDLCPGDCGARVEWLATLPMSHFEASGVSGDVPFTVDFPAPPRTFTIPATSSPAPTPPAPTPTPESTPGPKFPSGCTPERKGIGATPTSACAAGDPLFVVGPKVKFCADSDDLLPGQDGLLASMVTKAKAVSSVELHGNASVEGPSGDYNRSLSCYRALAMRKILGDAGVTASMSVVGHGATSVYGDPIENRNVVMAVKSASTAVPSATPATPPGSEQPSSPEPAQAAAGPSE
jgi:outer membrane protein OmpA-like peptidoglycan-associated protein